jgi:hypothetical protein
VSYTATQKGAARRTKTWGTQTRASFEYRASGRTGVGRACAGADGVGVAVDVDVVGVGVGG